MIVFAWSSLTFIAVKLDVWFMGYYIHFLFQQSCLAHFEDIWTCIWVNISYRQHLKLILFDVQDVMVFWISVCVMEIPVLCPWTFWYLFLERGICHWYYLLVQYHLKELHSKSRFLLGLALIAEPLDSSIQGLVIWYCEFFRKSEVEIADSKCLFIFVLSWQKN